MREDFKKENANISLSLSGICAGYGRKCVLKDISFQTESGKITGLLGPNGCGKTTLLRVLCQQLPYTGTCSLKGQSLRECPPRRLARQISYIPQRSGIAISLPVTEVVLMGFNPVLGLLERPSAAQIAEAHKALQAVGMDAFAEEDYQKLSEGQKQLCILARTMVEKTSLLLLDEPESSLDFPHRHRIMKLLSQMVGERDIGALMTLHDPLLALEYCQELILLREGSVADILYPEKDPLPQMEKALSRIYGPLELRAIEKDGKRRFFLLSP